MLAISRRTLGLHLCCPRAAAIGKNKYLAGETSSGLTIETNLSPIIGYEAIGIIDSTLPTVAIFATASPAQTIPDIIEKLQAANAIIMPASATSFFNQQRGEGGSDA
ncbi:disulfide oxidoreductase [Culex quinquefasciatus]|uniref:Disulfide oxidoreductase n=1 Tax=Culex quinquefasciatus TaxID=7176 RepID=B0XHK0_CULQU|nr:disulfide oxidoreductase [Culex quinquefasciatus]|eukprot:XP_001869122.1 disulfide oxidoreductase [Culex quinquefasciatus]